MKNDPFERIFGLDTNTKPPTDKELILQGIKKELESIENKGERVTSIGFITKNATKYDINNTKQLGEILEGMDFSPHILTIHTLISQLETFHKKRMRDVVAYWQAQGRSKC